MMEQELKDKGMTIGHMGVDHGDKTSILAYRILERMGADKMCILHVGSECGKRELYKRLTATLHEQGKEVILLYIGDRDPQEDIELIGTGNDANELQKKLDSWLSIEQTTLEQLKRTVMEVKSIEMYEAKFELEKMYESKSKFFGGGQQWKGKNRHINNRKNHKIRRR